MGHPAAGEEVHPPHPGEDHPGGSGRERQGADVRHSGPHHAQHGVSEILMAAPAPQTAHRPKRGLRSQRGVALLMVIIGIAILTTIATEFAYNSRVDLELATNERDELQATYLAQSGIGMARLILMF